MEQGHGHEAHESDVDVERLVRGSDGGSKVGVAEHDALGQPGRA